MTTLAVVSVVVHALETIPLYFFDFLLVIIELVEELATSTVDADHSRTPHT